MNDGFRFRYDSVETYEYDDELKLDLINAIAAMSYDDLVAVYTIIAAKQHKED